NRFGLGARPGEARSIGADPRGWLTAQLAAPAGATAASPPESARVLAEARELRVVRQIAAQARANVVRPPQQETAPPAPGIDEDAIREFGAFIREHYVAQTEMRHRLAIEPDR